MAGLALQHPETSFQFAYRSHALRRSLRESLPSNASRAWLHSRGTLPGSAKLFHSLNQRLDSRFPKAIATFHDLFVISGEYSTEEFRARFAAQARAAAERADLLIAVSQFTASQLTDLLGVDPGRIRVIHHGVEVPTVAPPPDSSRENLILHVGAIQKRKNLARLVAAFEAMPAGWRLVLAGSQGFGATEILERIARSPRRADIELPGYVTDAQLNDLYGRARVFAFPSLDEGFGMPVLDAMARGVPVLTSSGSALSEVAGDAAYLVEVDRTEAIVEGLRMFGDSEEQRQKFRVRGLRRTTEFSWTKAVEATWAVYAELL